MMNRSEFVDQNKEEYQQRVALLPQEATKEQIDLIIGVKNK